MKLFKFGKSFVFVFFFCLVTVNLRRPGTSRVGLASQNKPPWKTNFVALKENKNRNLQNYRRKTNSSLEYKEKFKENWRNKMKDKFKYINWAFRKNI